MPPRDQSRAALNRRRSQVSDTLKNGISAAFGGAYDADDIVLNANDERRIMDLIAEQGEKYTEEIMAKHKLVMDAAKARARAAALQNFGAPTSQQTTGAAPKFNNDETQKADLAGDLTQDGSPEKILDRTAQANTAEQENPRASNFASDVEENQKATPEEDQGLKHCPYDGQILNFDGTCPAGDHTSLGRQTPPPIPAQARGNGQTPPPIPPQAGGRQTPPPIPAQARGNGQTPPPIPPAVILASIKAEGDKKMTDLDNQLNAAKKELSELRDDAEKAETRGSLIKLSGCSCITVIGPFIGAILLYLNYQKQGKIEKEMKRVEEQISNIEKARAETAQKYKLKI